MKKTNLDKFRQFLIEAKKHTYASKSNNSAVDKPLLPGSKQLEWNNGNLLYRDVYFGSGFFVGLETVFENDRPIWGMSYSGGAIEQANIGNIGSIYAFLRRALENVRDDKPFRGPQNFEADGFVYRMKCEGGLERFSGKEEIFFGETLCYELPFSGGWVS